MHILYEYVEHKFVDVVELFSAEKVYNLCNELWQLGTDLAMIGVRSNITVDSLGWAA